MHISPLFQTSVRSARFLELGYQFADIDIIRFVFPPPVAFADDLQTEVKSPPASPEKPV